MTRLRWGLGAALVLLSLAAARQALATYVDHGLVLGAAAVGVLAVIALVGFASLARARLRLTGDALERGRLARLDALRAAGAVPDVEALARATAAEEQSRAYLGRYFVAVTVLVGLVGTFAGLAETVRAVAPLLSDARASPLEVIAGPLGGLEVTFGASIVGILVTLALGLVQGDLVLAEELALARLEERTRHEWLPARWPPAEGAAERAVRELAELRRELAGVLSASVGATAERVAAIARAEVDRLGAELSASAGRHEDAQRELAARVAAEVGRAATATVAALADGSARREATDREQVARLTDALARAGAELGTHAGAIEQAVASSATSATTAIASAATATVAALADGSARRETTDREQVARLTDALARAGAELGTHAGAIEQAVASSAMSATAAIASAATVTVAALADGSARREAADREQAARLTEALARAGAELGTHAGAIEHAVASSATAATAAIASAATATVAALADGSARREAADREQAARLTDALARAGATFGKQAAAIEKAVATTATAATGALASAATATLAALADGSARREAADREHAATLAGELARAATATTEAIAAGAASHGAAQRELFERLEVALGALAAQHRDAIVGAGAALAEGGARIDGAAERLGAAAADLGARTASLGPALAALGPELSALAREVALLAARTESEEPALVLDEVARLGDGLERLEALLRLDPEREAR